MPGHIFKSGTGELPYTSIYYVVVPDWSEGRNEMVERMKQSLMKCMMRTARDSQLSVVIPLDGFHGYPVVEVLRVILSNLKSLDEDRRLPGRVVLIDSREETSSGVCLKLNQEFSHLMVKKPEESSSSRKIQISAKRKNRQSNRSNDAIKFINDMTVLLCQKVKVQVKIGSIEQCQVGLYCST